MCAVSVKQGSAACFPGICQVSGTYTASHLSAFLSKVGVFSSYSNPYGDQSVTDEVQRQLSLTKDASLMAQDKIIGRYCLTVCQHTEEVIFPEKSH